MTRIPTDALALAAELNEWLSERVDVGRAAESMARMIEEMKQVKGDNVMTETWYRKVNNGTETIEVQCYQSLGSGKWVKVSERDPVVPKKYVCIRDGEECYCYFSKSKGWLDPNTCKEQRIDYWLDPPSQPSPALKPCPNPSCKSNHVRVAEHPFDESVYGVYCLECIMAGPRHKIKWYAITLWNTLPR